MTTTDPLTVGPTAARCARCATLPAAYTDRVHTATPGVMREIPVCAVCYVKPHSGPALVRAADRLDRGERRPAVDYRHPDDREPWTCDCGSSTCFGRCGLGGTTV